MNIQCDLVVLFLEEINLRWMLNAISGATKESLGVYITVYVALTWHYPVETWIHLVERFNSFSGTT